MTDEELWQQLDTYAQSLEPRLQRALLQAFQRWRDAVPEAEWLYAARTGDFSGILDKLDLSDFKLAVRQAIIDTALKFPLMSVRFDTYNDVVQRAIQQSEQVLVSDLTTEVKDGIQLLLSQGLRNGVNPVDTASDLKEIIGLTPKQVQSVLNYERLLTSGPMGEPVSEALRRALRDGRFDRSIQRAIAGHVPLKPEKVAQQVARYRQRLLRHRAEVIARTESMDALNRAQWLQYQQAVADSDIEDTGLYRRFWFVAPDENVCPLCLQIAALNKDGVGLDEPFQTPTGVLMYPTAHPLCRCVVFVKFLYAQKRVKHYSPFSNLRKVA